MARTPRYHPDFDRDVIDAAEWYSERNRELAADFVSKVHVAISRLLSDPECRTPVDYGIRYWPLERFPHVVLYDFTDTEILVLGVKHPSQRFGKWKARKV